MNLKALVLAAALAPAIASATPLRLDYTVSDLGGGVFQYEFTLTVDDNDGSYANGQAWRWFIWGDQASMPTNLTDWIGDPGSLPVGPWTFYTSSGGGHNGPTFGGVLDYWTPGGVGDSLTWQGTSTADLPDGELLFSTLAGTLGGGIAANWEPAHRGGDKCLPDCNLDGELNTLDFLCFLNFFSNGDPEADYNNDGVINTLDFLAFLNDFNAGCE